MAKQRRKWDLTDPMTDQKMTIGGHTYWRHKTTGLWWSKDTAGPQRKARWTKVVVS